MRIRSIDLRSQIARFHKRNDDLSAKLGFGLRSRLDASRRRLTAAHLRIISFDFRMKIAALRLRLEKRQTDLAARAERLLRIKRERLDRLRLQLEERSPLRALERGYAIATDAAGLLLRDSAQVALGDTVNIQLHRGRLTTEVRQKGSDGN
jgi:exodeoxyribonuclease VII large subunit